MSISSEDRLVNLMSHWLARHAGDEQLRAELDDADGLSPEQSDAVMVDGMPVATDDGRDKPST